MKAWTSVLAASIDSACVA